MTTRAEEFRAQQQREANPPKPKSPPKPRRDTPVDTSKPGVSATDRKAGKTPDGGVSTALRNESDRADKREGAVLEDSATGTPSRKSTRKSSGSVKRTTNLQRREIRETSGPTAAAEKAAANATRPRGKPRGGA